MKLCRLEPEATVPAKRGEVVVCIPVFGAHDYFVSCLRSVLAHTPDVVQILVCDDASPDRRSEAFVEAEATTSATAHTVSYLRRPVNLGFPGNVNGAIAMTAPADLVILNSDCEVADGWLEGLRGAAYADGRVATATALTNHGTIVSVPYPGKPSPDLPAGWTIDAAAAAIRDASHRIHPRIPTAVGHCVYVRRHAFELVGVFDEAFSPGYGEEVDFSQRCLHAGLSHVVADDVLVLHRGEVSMSVGGRSHPSRDRNERLLSHRYPYYHRAVQDLENDYSSPLARALSAARRTLIGTTVTIDGRILTGPMTGTQLQVLEVVAALVRTQRLHLTVIMPEHPGDYAQRTLSTLPDVRLVSAREVAAYGLERADLVHRPYQVGTHEDIPFLAPLGERLVITNQDLISFENPLYFRRAEGWQGYRNITRMSLALADHVVFISAHGRDEALREDLIDESRSSVIHNGVDHTLLGAANAKPAAPARAELLPPDAAVLLCLGTDFRHKNRLFALRLLRELRERHGWDGYLAMAGPHISYGSSASDEAEWLARHPEIKRSVVDLSAVSESGKAWLYERCSLVLYPTVYEGFGLVPFEAADHDRPCLWAPTTALAEVLGPDAGQIVTWSPTLTAERALSLLVDPAARRDNIESIRSAARKLTWDRAAVDLLDIYQRVCDMPATPASAVERRMRLTQGLFTQDAVSLIGPNGALPPEFERPLLALATHPQIGRPVFGAMRLGYRAGYRWRRLFGRTARRRRLDSHGRPGAS